MAKTRSWEVSDQFWKRVELFIPEREREPGKIFRRRQAVAGNGCPSDVCSKVSSLC